MAMVMSERKKGLDRALVFDGGWCCGFEFVALGFSGLEMSMP
jgi:hypothetical protein